MTQLYSNNALSTVATQLEIADTTLFVAAGTGLLFTSPTGVDYELITLETTSGDIEIIRLTSRSVDTFTISRAQEGTTALTFPADSKVEGRLTAGTLDSFSTFDETAGPIIIGNAALSDLGGTGAIAIGASAYCDGTDSIAIGTAGYTEGSNNISMGLSVDNEGDSNIAIGNEARIINLTDDSVAIGHSAWNNNAECVGIGFQSLTSADYAIALGSNSTGNASRAISIGNYANAGGAQSIAIGYSISSTSTDAVLIGTTVDGGVAKTNTIAIGNLAKADNNQAIAIGKSADAGGAESIAIGNVANAAADDGVSIGNTVVNTGSSGVAIGPFTSATVGTSAVCIGVGASSTATSTVSIGTSSDCDFNDGVSIGNSSSGKGTGSVAIGKFAWAVQGCVSIGQNAFCTTGTQAISIGESSQCSGAQSIAIGRSARAVTDRGIVLGNQSRSFVVTDSIVVGGLASNHHPFNWSQGDEYTAGNTGLTSTLTSDPIDLTGGSTWVATTAYNHGDVVKPTTPNGYQYVWYDNSFDIWNDPDLSGYTPSSSGSSEPTWPTAVDSTVNDGGGTWLTVDNSGYTLNLADDFMVEEVMFVAYNCSGITVQANISIGNTGALTSIINNQVTVGLTADKSVTKWTPSQPVIVSDIVLSIDTLATGTQMLGNFIVKGFYAKWGNS